MRTLLFVSAAFILFGCHTSRNAVITTSTSSSAYNSLTNDEKNSGWILLFDGTSKTGWHIYNNRTSGDAWKVADGILYMDPTTRNGGGDLTSNEEYENFDFKLEWKVDTGSNSGVIFNILEDPKYRVTYVTGLEMQILDNERHPDAKIIKHRAGDLYDMITSSPETVKPALQWNQAEIIQNNGKLEFFLNGTKVVSTTEWDDNWNNMIANSKFKSMADFGKAHKGKIALQDHGNKVWFRNIKIKRL